jgi:hypothetical protein
LSMGTQARGSCLGLSLSANCPPGISPSHPRASGSPGIKYRVPEFQEELFMPSSGWHGDAS